MKNNKCARKYLPCSSNKPQWHSEPRCSEYGYSTDILRSVGEQKQQARRVIYPESGRRMVRELKLGPALLSLSRAGAHQGQWMCQWHKVQSFPLAADNSLLEPFLPLLQPTAAATEQAIPNILPPHYLLLFKFRELTWDRENGGMLLPKPHFTIPPFDAFFLLLLQLPTLCIMMDPYPLSKEGFEHHRRFSENSLMLTSCQKDTHNALGKQ